MNLSSVIDVAIGLAFTYFLLALIASGVQEVFAGILAWRGTYLSKGIGVIIDNNEAARFAWVDFADFLRAHFTPRPGKTAAQMMRERMRTNTTAPTEAEQTLQKILDVQSHPLLRSTPSTLPSYVPSRNFALALLDVLQDGSKAPLIVQAENTVAALPSGDLKRTLAVFLQDAGGDIDKFRAHLEHWFDDAMDRVSGLYKRWSQYVLIALGLVLAISLNVDTFRVARTLWADPGERAALVQEAIQARMTANPPSTATRDAAEQGWRQTKAAIDEVESAGLPIGWNLSATSSSAIVRLIGWLVTGLAVGLGAPFWFGLIQNLTNMRAAGAAPARAEAPQPAVIPAGQ